MKAVITVVGADRTGILALVASECAARNCNILDVSQTIVDGVFTMTMIADMDGVLRSLCRSHGNRGSRKRPGGARHEPGHLQGHAFDLGRLHAGI